jgi:hypothetical protein
MPLSAHRSFIERQISLIEVRDGRDTGRIDWRWKDHIAA